MLTKVFSSPQGSLSVDGPKYPNLRSAQRFLSDCFPFVDARFPSLSLISAIFSTLISPLHILVNSNFVLDYFHESLAPFISQCMSNGLFSFS